MILTDTGFIVALFDRDDRCHTRCVKHLKNVNEQLATTWAVLTECFFLLNFSRQVQDDLWEFINRGGFQIYHLDRSMTVRCREMMNKYHDLPMDLADATMVSLGEELGIDRILTLDHRDFSVYRMKNGKRFKMLPKLTTTNR